MFAVQIKGRRLNACLWGQAAPRRAHLVAPFCRHGWRTIDAAWVKGRQSFSAIVVHRSEGPGSSAGWERRVDWRCHMRWLTPCGRTLEARPTLHQHFPSVTPRCLICDCPRRTNCGRMVILLFLSSLSCIYHKVFIIRMIFRAETKPIFAQFQKCNPLSGMPK